jgi:hypothetical protein
LTIDLGSDPGATKDLDSKAGDAVHKPSAQAPQSGNDEPVNEEPVDDEPDDGGVIDTPLGGGRPGDPDLPLP